MKRTIGVLMFMLFQTQILYAKEDLRLHQVHEQAREIGRAFVQADVEKVADLTFPKVLELAGGREKLTSLLQRGIQDSVSKGYVFTAFEVNAPKRIFVTKEYLFAILPTVILIKTSKPDGQLIQKAFLLAISTDQAKTWTFIDGIQLTQETIRRVFPDFPQKIKFPKKQPPVFSPSK